MKRIALIAILVAGCASMRMRVDPTRLKKVETIAPVTFTANRFVLPPGAGGGFPTDQTSTTSTTADMIFSTGIPAFLEAVRNAERFRVAPPEKVLAAKSYLAFPTAFTGVNASSVQVANGWRYVRPEDAEKIRNLLEEIDADAALVTYWSFTLDAREQGDVGLETASTRAHLRAWLVDRDGKVVADDEFDVPSDETLPVHNGYYDAHVASPLFDDAITTCAVRLVADLSNARAKARGE